MMHQKSFLVFGLAAVSVFAMLCVAVPVHADEATGTITTGVTAGLGGTVVIAPTATPGAGTYTLAQSVVLSAVGASSIHYTTNGATSTCTTGTTYSGAISVGSSLTIKAVSCYPNSVTSDMVPFAYTINIPAPPAPTVYTGGGGGGGGYYNPYTLMVNGGATSTVSTSVTLAITTLAGVNQMWISNDSSFATSTGTGWIPFQATYPWILTSGSGNKTVYVEFRSPGATTVAGTAGPA